jgi:hypothetical protein
LNRQGQDRRIFEELIRFLDKKKTSTKFPGKLMLDIGKFFLGTPYVAGILETKKAEHLVVNLREHDCVTFVENVVALVWAITSRWSPTGKPVAPFRRSCGATSAAWRRDKPSKDDVFSDDQGYSIMFPRGKSFEAFRRLLQKIRCRATRPGFIIFQTGSMITRRRAS